MVDVADSVATVESAENKEALLLWHRVMLEGVRESTFDLSARQMALLLHIFVQPGQHTVKRLSEELNISKPAICRALDSLSVHGLLQRKVDEKDRRNVYVVLTKEGHDFLLQFSERILVNLMALQ